MKILHTADWHIGQFKGPVVDGVNLRSQDTVNCLNYMIKVAEEEKPDIVCVSGDVFHQEQIGPVRYSDEMIVATDTITKLAGVAKAVIVMRGTPNHDGGGQFRVLSKMFANTGNVHIVTSPTVLRTPYADIACIPGFDKQEFRSRFPGLSADEENEAWTSYISSMVMGLRAECHNTSILMAHYTVPGCNMESGQTSFFTNFEPVIPREALEAAGYEAVLLGHIHRPQQINGLHNVYYSGAINAMNFNDEHQNRGFYIHEFMGGEMTSSQFCGTPYRRFKTIDWDTNQVSDYIGNRDAYALVTNISRDISDMIVRVKYSCTSEQKKLLNIPLLQKDLYDWGAFYVSDIEAENAIDVTNRGLLSEESDPTLNLKKYLEEKCFKNPDKIVELAEPIIAEAMKQSTTAEIHGVFRPISIAVRNYRTPEAFKVIKPYNRDRGQFICCFTQQAQPDFKGALMDSTMVLFDAKHTDKGQISRNVVTEEQEECFERYMKMGAMCFLVISLEFEEFYRVPWRLQICALNVKECKRICRKSGFRIALIHFLWQQVQGKASGDYLVGIPLKEIISELTVQMLGLKTKQRRK